MVYKQVQQKEIQVFLLMYKFQVCLWPDSESDTD